MILFFLVYTYKWIGFLYSLLLYIPSFTYLLLYEILFPQFQQTHPFIEPFRFYFGLLLFILFPRSFFPSLLSTTAHFQTRMKWLLFLAIIANACIFTYGQIITEISCTTDDDCNRGDCIDYNNGRFCQCGMLYIHFLKNEYNHLIPVLHTQLFY